jgi:hypothetical protein
MVRVSLTLIVLAILGPPVITHAAPLTVVNHSFESQVLLDGAFDRGPMPSWTSPADPGNDDSGTFNPQTTSFPGEAPDGANVAFIGGSAFFVAQAITQALSSNLLQGSYELRVDVGDRLDTTFAGYRIELRAGANILAADNNSLVPANGEFVTSLVTLNAHAANPNLGQPLSIRLLAVTPGSQVQTDFDNVRLDFAVTSLAGDYNGNGIVDAADYTVWRDHLGQNFNLTNEKPAAATPGVVDAEDYDFWKSNFGESLGSGFGATANAAVPEATTLVLLILAAASSCLRQRPTRR